MRYHGYEAEVTVPEGVSRIARDAFRRRKNLVRGLILSEGVAEMEEAALAGLPELNSVTLPGSLRTVPKRAFSGCGALRQLRMAEGVEDIGAEAFSDCRCLDRIAFPGSLRAIGRDAFLRTKWADDAPEGPLFAGPVLFLYKGDCPPETELRPGTAAVACSAFSNQMNLRHITLPDTLTHIGDAAFWYCFALRDLTLPEGLTHIGSCAFSGCESLRDVTIPDSVVSIGDLAFDCIPGLILHGRKGSPAERYAWKHGLAFAEAPGTGRP